MSEKQQVDLQQIPLSESINDRYLDEYEKEIEIIRQQLALLHNNIVLLESIYKTPFYELHLTEAEHFFSAVEKSLFESCLMIIWRSVIDNGPYSTFTISKLKNQIAKLWLKECYKDSFSKQLKEINFVNDHEIACISDKIEEILHNYLAHLNYNKHIKQKEDDLRGRDINFSELKKVKEKITEFFDVLCLGCGREIIASQWTLNGEISFLSQHTEKILDSIVKDSSYLKSLENDEYWRDIGKHKVSDENLEIINRYRIKFGRPPLKK